MEKIALNIPLSSEIRPQWDIKLLNTLDVKNIITDLCIWKRVLSETEKINYVSTPMFLVRGIKL